MDYPAGLEGGELSIIPFVGLLDGHRVRTPREKDSAGWALHTDR